MAFELPPLPYEKNALEPIISAETLEYHYDKHHRAYVTNLNNLIKGTEFEGAALEDIIRKSSGGVFNNAAQVWNHTFYWHSMRKPLEGNAPAGKLADAINKAFGSFDKFQTQFSAAANGIQGSGWAVLAYDSLGDRLLTFQVYDHQTNFPLGVVPLLLLDMWEHAFYLQYKNVKADYTKAFWNVVNWPEVQSRYAAATSKAKGLISG